MLVACGADVADTNARQRVNHDAFRQWKLPGRLREISGLALTPDERLLAVTDERAVVYELDYTEGKITKSFALGDPPVRADFEGIAVLDDTIWLMTSDGLLFAAEEGADGQNQGYRQYETGLGDYCELEGLAQDVTARSLLLACKETDSRKDKLMIFEWAVSQQGVERIRDIDVPEKSIGRLIDKKRISPSGIAVDRQSGDWILVAARQTALIRMKPDGDLIDAIILDKKGRHRQAEGIEMTVDGRMLIADEGGNGRARLAVYPAGSPGSKQDE